MTDLEQLSRFIAFYDREKENVGYTGLDNWLEEYGQDFLNSLRNSDSSADNNKVEQSATDEELMAKIEDMVAELFSDRTSGSFCSCYEGDLDDCYPQEVLDIRLEFGIRLKDLFKTHRNTVSTAVNQKGDNLVNEKQLVDKIAKIVFQAKENVKSQSFQISCNNFAEEIVKIFKTHQNSVLRPVNKQYDNLLSQEDLLSKMNSLIWDFANDFTCCNQDQEFYFVEDFKSELIKLFTSCLNPVFRALNDSDEQSIIK